MNISSLRIAAFLKTYFSRFHYKSIHNMVYMLQASEYHVADYVAWLGRVKNFGHVENRKHLTMSWKALALLICGWALTSTAAFLAVEGFRSHDIVAHVVAFVVVFGFPVALPRILLLPLLVLEAIQLPVEHYMIMRATKKLRALRGIKIAIAGSFGKTSMREILRTVLSEGKKVAAPGGSENTPIAIARFIQKLRGDEDVLIFEMGEYYPGDIAKLSKIVKPDIGIITGINEAHLSRFITLEKVSDTIFELADSLHNKPLYVNADNKVAFEKAHADTALFFSHEGVGEWRIVAPETSLEGTSFMLEKGSDTCSLQSKLLGLHQIGPLAAAVHIALSLGLSKKQIETGAAKTKPFAHRMERRDDASGVITLDDSYNGNPDGVTAVIDFLANIENHRRWYVTPGLVEMGNRSEVVHKEIGRQLAMANIEKVVLIKNSVTPWIEDGLRLNQFRGEILWFTNALKCYAALPAMTVYGDVVLLQNDWPDQYA